MVWASGSRTALQPDNRSVWLFLFRPKLNSEEKSSLKAIASTGMTQDEQAREETLPTRASLLDCLKGEHGTARWQQGWQEFFSLYQPVICRYAMQSGFSPSEADEIAQEALIGVARQMPSFRYNPEQCSFKTWLFRISRNKMVDHRRRKRVRRQGQTGVEATEDEIAAIPDDQTLTPDRAWDLEFERHLREAALKRVAQTVKPMTMRLFLHNVVEGHDVAATVEAFRESKVKPTDVHQARFRVQAKLEQEIEALRRKGG